MAANPGERARRRLSTGERREQLLQAALLIDDLLSLPLPHLLHAATLDEADDLVQECLARAIARTRVWSEIRNVRAYLFTILHNLHIDRISRGRTAGMAVPLDHVEHKLTTKPAQEEGLRIRDLERALRVLPDDYRKAVLLVGLEGMSYQEAATTLGIPIGTVMSRLSRGRETLRQLMATDAHGKLRMVR